jgi:serine phosphatase RsbU (regulator of sigma subunit)
MPQKAFDAPSRTVDLVPGDVLVLYTDGSFEARNRAGEQLGLDMLRSLVRLRDAPQDWPQFIAAQVDKHTGGSCDDDVLIASVTFKAQRPQPTAAEIEARLSGAADVGRH